MTKPKPEHRPAEELELEIVEQEKQDQLEKLKKLVIRTQVLEQKIDEMCQRRQKK